MLSCKKRAKRGNRDDKTPKRAALGEITSTASNSNRVFNPYTGKTVSRNISIPSYQTRGTPNVPNAKFLPTITPAQGDDGHGEECHNPRRHLYYV
jgi:hypothetical protein